MSGGSTEPSDSFSSRQGSDCAEERIIRRHVPGSWSPTSQNRGQAGDATSASCERQESRQDWIKHGARLRCSAQPGLCSTGNYPRGLVVGGERPELHAKFPRQLRQHQQADVELSPLQAGDKRAVEIRRQRELFLTDALGPSRLAETCADRPQEGVGSLDRHARMLAARNRKRLRDISVIPL